MSRPFILIHKKSNQNSTKVTTVLGSNVTESYMYLLYWKRVYIICAKVGSENFAWYSHHVALTTTGM